MNWFKKKKQLDYGDFSRRQVVIGDGKDFIRLDGVGGRLFVEGKLISEFEVVSHDFGVQKMQIDASSFEKGIYLMKYFNGLDQISSADCLWFDTQH